MDAVACTIAMAIYAHCTWRGGQRKCTWSADRSSNDFVFKQVEHTSCPLPPRFIVKVGKATGIRNQTKWLLPGC